MGARQLLLVQKRRGLQIGILLLLYENFLHTPENPFLLWDMQCIRGNVYLRRWPNEWRLFPI